MLINLRGVSDITTSLSTFMKVALTAVIIVALLFGVAYSMIEVKTDEYEGHIRDLQLINNNE